MAPSPIEIARLAKRLFQQAYPERYWIGSAQSIQDPGAPIFATEEERQSFLDLAKRQIARAAALGASEPADSDAVGSQKPEKRSP